MKKTFSHQIEVRRDGVVFVQFAKCRFNPDGTADGEPQWHRTVFEPDTDIDEHMKAVNAHLASMGEAEALPADVETIRAHARLARTPANVKAWAAKKAAAIAAAAAEEKAAEDRRKKNADLVSRSLKSRRPS